MAKAISTVDIQFVKQKALDSLIAKDDGEGIGPEMKHVEELVDDVFRLLTFGGFLTPEDGGAELKIVSGEMKF